MLLLGSVKNKMKRNEKMDFKYKKELNKRKDFYKNNESLRRDIHENCDNGCGDTGKIPRCCVL